jgi:hypothetical protein
MSRVEEERAAQRYEDQKRLEKDLRAKNDKSAEQFQKVVNAKTQTSLKVQKQQQTSNNNTRHQQSSSRKGQAQSALLAKSGIQSRNLQAELLKQSASSQDTTRTEGKGRQDELQDLRGAEHERQVTTQKDSEQRTEKYNDHLAAVSREEEQHRGSGDGEGDSGQMGGGQMGMPMQQQQVAATAEVQSAGGTVKIPQALIASLVKQCAVKVNPKGLTEFQIDLRDDVLGGSSVKVSANGRKISATVVSSDANIRRLFKASEGELARAFDGAGLSLESFRVSAF